LPEDLFAASVEHTDAHEGTPWPTIRPLDDNHGLAPFPAEALPGVVGDLVGAVATDIQVARGAVALAVLSALSVALGGRVQIRARGGWVVPCVLWTCTVLPTGERKSEAFKRVIFAPLDAWSREQQAKRGGDIGMANAPPKRKPIVGSEVPTRTAVSVPYFFELVLLF
jgi:hypothetical protein